jgi:opacity protein-like surface antigen
MIGFARNESDEAVMRRLLAVLGLIASTCGAFAQVYDGPALRGSDVFVPPPVCCSRWAGFYAGGQLGASVGSFGFQSSTQTLVADMLRELALESDQMVSQWQVLGKGDQRATSFGGFVGYNTAWESLILGVELNYSRTDMLATAPMEPITRVTSAGGNTYLVTVAGTASMHITDIATLRARAGWDTGIFLPYAMIGVAAGRASLAHSATVSGIENPTTPPTPCNSLALPPCTPFFFFEGEQKPRAFVYGASIGGGFDLMLMPGLFLRAEYEYLAFSPVWGISANVQTARAGLGFKF